MQLSQKKIFSIFFSPYFKIRIVFEYFQKKVTFIADVFLSLGTPKNVVRQMCKKSHFRAPFDK